MTDQLLELQDAGYNLTPDPGGGGGDPVSIEATVEWVLAKLTIDEGAPLVAILAKLSVPLPREVRIPFVVLGSTTATRDVDYTLSQIDDTDVIRFGAGAQFSAVRFTALSDAVADANEFVDIVLDGHVSTVEGVTITVTPVTALSTTRVVIGQPAPPPPGNVLWSFETNEAQFFEGQSGLFTRVRVVFSAPTEGEAVMRFWTVDGTATAPGDYVAIDALVTVPVGTTQFSIPLTLVDDETEEPEETFVLNGSVINGPITNGAVTSCVVTIEASDTPAEPPVADWEDTELDAVEQTDEGAEVFVYATVQLTEAAAANTFIPAIVEVLAGDFSRVQVVWPGGTPNVIRVLEAQSTAQVGFRLPQILGDQGLVQFTVTLLPGSQNLVGQNSALTVTITDNGATAEPILEWEDVSEAFLFEDPLGGPVSVVRNIVISNYAEIDPSTQRTVNLAFAGVAVAGVDFQCTSHPLLLVVFPPNTPSVAVTFQVIADGVVEAATEAWTCSLTNPGGGAVLGTQIVLPGSVVDGAPSVSANALRPEFYFPSEVIGKGPQPTDTALVIDLGPGNETRTYFYEVTVDCYSPNATEGVHYEFPSGKTCVIDPASRFGTLPFRALAPGLATTQRWVVVEMVSANKQGDPIIAGAVGNPSQVCRWTAVICGATDTKGLIPPDPVPPAVDYQVSRTQIVDLVHGLTIPLPWPSNWSVLPAGWTPTLRSNLEAAYGTIASAVVLGNDNDRMNGLGIAAHLAQKVWIDRNSTDISDPNALGTLEGPITSPAGEAIYYLDPVVPYLDEGVPVRIDIMEDLEPARSELNFGGKSGHEPNNKIVGVVSWNDHWTVGGSFYPGMVRDLWITGSGGTLRTIGVVTMRDVKFHNNSNTTLRQFFMDNVHLVDLKVTKGTNPNTEYAPGEFWMSSAGAASARLRGQRLVHGLNYLDNVRWVRTGGGSINGAHFRGSRFNNPASWDIRHCQGTFAQQQWFYADAVGPIFRLWDNAMPNPGTGSHFLQLTQRPKAGGNSDGRFDGPGHGLCAIVANSCSGMAQNGLGGADFIVYGFTGYVFFIANLHVGPQYDPVIHTQVVYNRALLKVNATGNQAGMYLHETFPGSGEYYATRYVEIDEVTATLSPGGSWQDSAFLISGCERVVFRATTATTGPNLGGRPYIEFNGETTLVQGPQAVHTDPLGNVLTGPFTTKRLHNKGSAFGGPAGGVSFPLGFASVMGPQTGFNSTTRARHIQVAWLDWAEGGSVGPAPTERVEFTAALATYNGYTGTDLAP